MLKDKCAVVTGAGSGIGAATALVMVENGCKVICADINFENAKNVADEINSVHSSATGASAPVAVAIKADVSRQDDNVAMVQACVKHFGKIDVFFANAAILNKVVPINLESEESFLRTMHVNALSVFHAIKYSSEAMKECISSGKSKNGSIICTGSIAALRADLTPLQYTASKGAVLSMVQSASDRLLLDNIRVNSVVPGGVATDIYFTMAQNLAKEGLVLENYDYKRFPPIDAREIANVVCFLASDLSSPIKGQTIIADGGMSQSMGSQPYPKPQSEIDKRNAKIIERALGKTKSTASKSKL